MKTLQAVGVGFGVTLGFSAACVSLVMCGGAVLRSVRAQPANAEVSTTATPAAPLNLAAPAAPVEPRANEPLRAGWVLFDGGNLAMCRTQVLKDTSEETLAAAREKMKGWTPLPPGNNCNTLGGSARASCTGSDFQSIAYHYVGASAFGHVEALRKGCIEHGNVFKADF